MAKLVLQYNIENLTPATASPVEANYNRIEQHINQELLERDGTVAMRGQLKLAGDPVTPLEAATKQYVDQILPVGVMMPYGGAAAPPGGMWEICDGTQRQIATYPELFEVLGYAFGGSGGYFNLPGTARRVPIGVDGDSVPRGSTGGSSDAALPTHFHDMSHNHPATTTGYESNAHAHDVTAHAHSFSANTGAQSSYHQHGTADGAYEGFIQWDSSTAAGSWGGTPGLGFGVLGTTGYENATHIHSVSGTTGSSGAATGAPNYQHYHATTTPGYSGGTSSAGVSAQWANMPPYVAVQYIIRVR